MVHSSRGQKTDIPAGIKSSSWGTRKPGKACFGNFLSHRCRRRTRAGMAEGVALVRRPETDWRGHQNGRVWLADRNARLRTLRRWPLRGANKPFPEPDCARAFLHRQEEPDGLAARIHQENTEGTGRGFKAGTRK